MAATCFSQPIHILRRCSLYNRLYQLLVSGHCSICHTQVTDLKLTNTLRVSILGTTASLDRIDIELEAFNRDMGFSDSLDHICSGSCIGWLAYIFPLYCKMRSPNIIRLLIGGGGFYVPVAVLRGRDLTHFSVDDLPASICDVILHSLMSRVTHAQSISGEFFEDVLTIMIASRWAIAELAIAEE
ncbi:hypothetical protein B0H12DRAFT_1126212 [Mycena haematopus]|nr:hypothetical protein B0H12DRAFT_1126212 [Mycena haematopus]